MNIEALKRSFKKSLGLTTIFSLLFIATTPALWSIEESSSADYWQACSLANFREADCWQYESGYYTVARATGRNCKIAQASARKYADIWVEITYTKADPKRLPAVLKSGKVVKVQCTSNQGKSYAQILVKYSHNDLRDIFKEPVEPVTSSVDDTQNDTSDDINNIKDEDDCECEDCDDCDKENCEECEEHSNRQSSYDFDSYDFFNDDFFELDDDFYEAFYELDHSYDDDYFYDFYDFYDDFDFEG